MPIKKEARSDGRYQVSVSLGYENGKRKQKYFYGDTQKEAKRKRDEWLRGQANPKTSAPENTNVTVKEWAKKWLETYATGAYSTQQAHTSIVAKLTSVLGDKEIADITHADIQAFARQCESFSQSYVKKIRLDIESIFKSAIKNNLIASSPCSDVKWENAGSGSHRALEEWERTLIQEHWTAHPAGVWAMLMLYAGLRPGEALALNWSNILDKELVVCDATHFEGNRPVLITDWTKTGSAGIRRIPIVPPLKAMLSALERRDGELVCRSAEGKEITQSAYDRNWQSFTTALKFINCDVKPNKRGNFSGIRSDRLPEETVKKISAMEDIRPYDLRHTFCTMLYDAGVDVKTAQYLMGHKTLDMTMKIYTHLSEMKKKRSYDALHAYFK